LRRRSLIALIALGAVAFVAISVLLARVFGANGAEQSAITDLVKAEAAGDSAAMLQRIDGCAQSAPCRARVAYDASTLRRSGPIAILQLTPSTSFSLSAMVGTARVAWRAGSSLPIVQCVRVRRSGNVLSGLRVHLLAVSVRIKPSDRDCPARY
jgi:hypothetical protein